MKLSEIKKILKADVIFGEDQMEMSIHAGGAADKMDDLLSAVAEGSVILTGVTGESIIRTAKIVGFKAIVFVRGKKPEEKVLKLGKSYGIPMLGTRYSMFVACGRLYMNGLRGLDGSW